LAVHIAVIGSSEPRRALIHTSGLHGVEGFPGSAIQLQAMASLVPPPDSGDAIVIVHCINPYGMAWLRRWNENNVDLNRNFLFEEEAFRSASEVYRRLNSLLNPKKNARLVDLFYVRALLYVLCHGIRGPKQAVAEGQYEFQKGLFYGGDRLEQGPQKLLGWMKTHFQELRRAVCIDVHTGLGSFGQDVLWVGDPPGSPRFQTMKSHIVGVEPMAQSATGYRVQGGFLASLEEQLPQVDWYRVTQEFGTFGPLRVIKALRDENLYHHHSRSDDLSLSHLAKRNLLQTFSPASKSWRDSVLSRGEIVFQQAQQLAFYEPVPVCRL